LFLSFSLDQISLFQIMPTEVRILFITAAKFTNKPESSKKQLDAMAHPWASLAVGLKDAPPEVVWCAGCEMNG
jgi:hypothetical protein